MTNMSSDMAATSVTDFFTLPELGRVHQCLDPTISGRIMDRVEIDAYGLIVINSLLRWGASSAQSKSGLLRHTLLQCRTGSV